MPTSVVVREIIRIINSNKDPVSVFLEELMVKSSEVTYSGWFSLFALSTLINSTFAISLGTNHCAISSWQAFSVGMSLRNLMILHIQSATVLKTLEFSLPMLQLANKDGQIEGAAPGKGLLSISRGSRQLDAYIQSIIKNTNHMILYCFLPSFLISMGEYDFLSHLGLQIEPKKSHPQTL